MRAITYIRVPCIVTAIVLVVAKAAGITLHQKNGMAIHPYSWQTTIVLATALLLVVTGTFVYDYYAKRKL